MPIVKGTIELGYCHFCHLQNAITHIIGTDVAICNVCGRVWSMNELPEIISGFIYHKYFWGNL